MPSDILLLETKSVFVLRLTFITLESDIHDSIRAVFISIIILPKYIAITRLSEFVRGFNFGKTVNILVSKSIFSRIEDYPDY